jgi:hypothetical protein
MKGNTGTPSTKMIRRSIVAVMAGLLTMQVKSNTVYTGTMASC